MGKHANIKIKGGIRREVGCSNTILFIEVLKVG